MSKKSQRRDCPALGRSISSADCGSGRHSSIPCPASCPHNPFAPAAYDQLLALENKVDRAALDHLASEIGRLAVERLVSSRLPEDLDDLQDHNIAINAAVLEALHFENDSAGRSVVGRWLADRAARLSNDERILLTAKNRTRPALVEIREVRPDGLLLAADLLAPHEREFLVLDRACWARAVRFGVSLVWMYPLPYYRRIFGGGIAWPDWSGLDLDEVAALAEIVAHAGGPAADAPAEERTRWLATHFVDLIRRVFAVSRARRLDMFAGLDVVHGWAEFAPSPAAVERLHTLLEESPDVFPAEPEAKDDAPAGFTAAWDWHEPESVASPTGAPGRVVIGRVLRRDDGVWRVVAFGRARLDRLRQLFLAALGTPDLTPNREYVQDLAAQLSAKEPSADLSLVPPRLRENPARLDFSTTRLDTPPEDARHLVATRQLEGWIDASLPALGGRSPREAARDHAARPTLVRLLKTRIASADGDRLRGRPFTDPLPVVRELGLAELDRPAPPERPCPPEFLEDEDDPTAPPAALPPLPPATHRLDADEAGRRADEIYHLFPTDDDLLEAWDAACPGLSELIVDHIPDDYNDDEIEDLEFALALAWAILSGGTPRKLRLELNLIALAANASRESLENTRADEPGAARAVFSPVLSAHPGLIKVLLDDLAMREESLGREKDTFPMGEILHWLGAAIPAYIAGLDRA